MRAVCITKYTLKNISCFIQKLGSICDRVFPLDSKVLKRGVLGGKGLSREKKPKKPPENSWTWTTARGLQGKGEVVEVEEDVEGINGNGYINRKKKSSLKFTIIY